MPRMDYTRLLNRTREYCGYDQKRLAEAAGISESHFCQKIKGKYAFTQKEIVIICDILDIPADEIGLYFFSPEVEKTQQSPTLATK